MLTHFALLLALVAAPAPAPLPHPGTGSLVPVSFSSAALAGRESYLAWLPPDYSPERRYPIVVLLHGLGGEGADWFDPALGDLPRALGTLLSERRVPPFIALAPNGKNGYWTDHLAAPEARYGTFIDEVVADAERRFPIALERAVIVGVSMGGHGALSRALMDPTRYRAVVSLAGALFPEPPTHRQIYKQVWGDPADRAHWEATAPMALARRLTADSALPALFIHCGRADTDRFIDWNLAADQLLTQRGIPHELVLTEGGHGWTTWRSVSPRWLQWIAAYLR
jgi:S-formylglutathione hydrolase FrmB